MPYTGSKAQTGLGSSLSINTGSVGTPVWTVVGEVTNINQSGKSAATDDTTNMESSFEEFIPTLLKPGNVKIPMNRISGDAGQTAVLAAFNSLSLVEFQIQIPKNSSQTSTGDKWVFLALVEEFNDIGDIKPDKKITTEASLKVSGVITFTAGS